MADAGGPYDVAEGGSVQLDASASSDANQAASRFYGYLHDELTVRLQSEPLPEPWLAVGTYGGTVAPGTQA